VLLLLLTCKQKDPIAATIHRVADAAEDRDAAAVVVNLAASYADANGGRREAEDELRRYFFGYRSISVSIRDLQVFRNGNLGQARFVVEFTGVPKEIGGLDQILPSSAKYRFEVWLAEENGAWNITQAQWRPESASSN
jgi:hypothetical protein